MDRLGRTETLEFDTLRRGLEREDCRHERWPTDVPWQLECGREATDRVVLLVERIERPALETAEVVSDTVVGLDARREWQQPRAQPDELPDAHRGLS